MQAVQQKQKSQLAPATVDGYTVPPRGPIWSPEVNSILAYRPPPEPVKVASRHRHMLETDWEQRHHKDRSERDGR